MPIKYIKISFRPQHTNFSKIDQKLVLATIFNLHDYFLFYLTTPTTNNHTHQI